MGLVARSQRPQNLYGIVQVGFFQVHRLETPLQRGVFLNIAAVFVQRGCANDLQLASGQCRLEHVAGVDTTLGCAGAHHGVNLVQEQNYFPLRLLHLIHHRLEALFKLAPEFGTGDQGAHVQRQHPPAFKGGRHIPGGDSGGQTLCDGGLADTGFSNDHRVVLFATGQGLHHLSYFFIAANDRVQLAFSGQLGQVDAVFLQGPVLAFGPGVVHPVAASNLEQGLVHQVPVYAKLLQYLG